MNATYRGPGDLPDTIPVFPLPGALLLPRAQMPLNIFEPRYLAMVDAALAGSRLIGMIQPKGSADEQASNRPDLFAVGCAGRVVQFAEAGDGRYLVSLAGIARFRVEGEVSGRTPYRQCRVSFAPFAKDLAAEAGGAEVDRDAVLRGLRSFTSARGVKMDWDGIEETPNEALVNALCMLAPFGVREKQALLEAADLKTRAETLVALTDIELAKSRVNVHSTLQ